MDAFTFVYLFVLFFTFASVILSYISFYSYLSLGVSIHQIVGSFFIFISTIVIGMVLWKSDFVLGLALFFLYYSFHIRLELSRKISKNKQGYYTTMSIFNFLKPKWKHSNPAVRRKFILEKLRDESILEGIARTDEDSVVRMAAVSRIRNPIILKDIAENNDDFDVSNKASKKLRKAYKSILSSCSRDDIAKIVREEIANMDDTTKRELLRETRSKDAFVKTVIRYVSTRLINNLIAEKFGPVTSGFDPAPAMGASGMDQLIDSSMQQEVVSLFIEQIPSYEITELVTTMDPIFVDPTLIDSFIEMVTDLLFEE